MHKQGHTWKEVGKPQILSIDFSLLLCTQVALVESETYYVVM